MTETQPHFTHTIRFGDALATSRDTKEFLSHNVNSPAPTWSAE